MRSKVRLLWSIEPDAVDKGFDLLTEQAKLAARVLGGTKGGSCVSISFLFYIAYINIIYNLLY